MHLYNGSVNIVTFIVNKEGIALENLLSLQNMILINNLLKYLSKIKHIHKEA
jgi:hypothetical protein